MTYIWEEDSPLFIKHLDGVKWFDAPVPPRKHKCWVQTSGIRPDGYEVYRCACGATQYPRDRDGWHEKNSRKSDEPEEKVRWWKRWNR